jgi:RNA polymerase-interacting CarD/CdnL/TRCF family regulator
MPTYHTYKNGIYGKRYKTLYIVPSKDNEKKTWAVKTESGVAKAEGLLSLQDAEWEIDKLKATDEEERAINLLYQQSIPELTELISNLYTEKNQTGLSANEDMMLDFALKIRERKIDGKFM